MSKINIFIIAVYIAFVVFLIGCTTNTDIAGSGTEAGNGRVVGRITNAGEAAPNTKLLLIPADFTSGNSDFKSEITDSAGHYTFDNTPPGNYSIEGVQLDSRKRILILSVKVDADQTTDIGPDSVRNTGSLRISLPDSMHKTGGKIMLQGTTFGVNISNDSFIIIDSLPSEQLPPLVYLADSAAKPKTLLSDITVQPGDTTVLSAISSKKFIVHPGEDLQAAVDKLLPGDSLLLAGGEYKNSGISISSHGNALQPITIAAVAGQTPIMRITVETNNCININSAQWLTIDGLAIDSTPPGVDGIKFTESGVSHNVTIRNCTVHAVQGTGINAQGGHYSITISSNHIYDIIGDGVTGIRVAPAATSSAPHDWLIANNWVHTIGDSLSNAAYGISINSRCQTMTVRDNVVYSAASSCIIVYGLGDPTSNGALSSVVEGNAVWNAPEGVSAYSDVTVRNNVIFNCSNPVYSYSYQGATPRNVLIYNNTMYNGEAPYLRSWDSTNNCVFINNAVYSMTGGFTLIGNGLTANNAGDVSSAGFITGTASADMIDPANRNFYPKPGSTLINKGDRVHATQIDFNGTVRDSQTDIGAYEYVADGNPGWKIKEGFKGK